MPHSSNNKVCSPSFPHFSNNSNRAPKSSSHHTKYTPLVENTLTDVRTLLSFQFRVQVKIESTILQHSKCKDKKSQFIIHLVLSSSTFIFPITLASLDSFHSSLTRSYPMLSFPTCPASSNIISSLFSSSLTYKQRAIKIEEYLKQVWIPLSIVFFFKYFIGSRVSVCEEGP